MNPVAINVTAALLASASVASVPAEGVMAFAERFGVVAALLFYFVIRDINNQKRLDKEQEKKEAEYRELVKHVRGIEGQVIDALKDNTEAMRYCRHRSNHD